MLEILYNRRMGVKCSIGRDPGYSYQIVTELHWAQYSRYATPNISYYLRLLCLLLELIRIPSQS